MNDRPVIRPALRSDFEKFYGHAPDATVRAIVGDLGGEIIAIGGIAFSGGHFLVFSEMKPEARRFRREIVLGARRIVEMCRGLPVIAVRHEVEPGSERFLKYLGFVSIGNGGYILTGEDRGIQDGAACRRRSRS